LPNSRRKAHRWRFLRDRSLDFAVFRSDDSQFEIPVYFWFSLIPATLVVVLGYFVLFSSTKTQGGVKAFGQILAAWVLILAAFFPLAGAYATFTGVPSIGEMMRSMHSGGNS
jgi:hypothetical protein